MKRTIANEITTLDPETDFLRIVYLLTCYEFPWDIERALEFALFRTYAVPSISKLLVQTGELVDRTRKRYDDTELILYEVLENGFDSERGQAAIRRMNQMHGRFPISNEDFLYVLSTFIFEPIRWIRRFGWRSLTAAEEKAIFNYYRTLGRYMNINDIPTEIDQFEQFNQQYEERYFQFHPDNLLLGQATRNLVLGFYLPKPLFKIGEPFVYALMDKPLITAFGFPTPSAFHQSISPNGLKLRSQIIRYFPERKKPKLGTQAKRPTYPDGYEIDQLGV